MEAVGRRVVVPRAAMVAERESEGERVEREAAQPCAVASRNLPSRGLEPHPYRHVEAH